MDIEKLITAVENFRLAKKNLLLCRQRNDYRDEEYECAAEIDWVQRKKAELVSVLNQYIDSRIRHVLSGTE